MKKVIATIVAVIACLFCVAACDTTPQQATYEENVSFMQTDLYSGGSSNFEVNISCGEKEEMFLADGKVGNVVKFSTLTLIPLHMDLFEKSYAYKLTGQKGECSGEFKKDMFGVSFSAEIEDISNLGEVTSVLITADSVEETVALTNQLTDMMSWKEALSIACKEMKAELDECMKNNTVLPREIYIKFINDKNNTESPYYWYVAFIGSGDDYWALLIEPKEGEIISKKM